MNVNVQQIYGSWCLGYSLDKHILSSVPIGEDEHGRMQFDNTRTNAGEAIYQLKYKDDQSQVVAIARQIKESLATYFCDISVVIPMPPTQQRPRQPVLEIATEFARLINVPCLENLLIKTTTTQAMKDIPSKQEKVTALLNALSVNPILKGDYLRNILIIDDIYDSGASLEAATKCLRSYQKINKIYVATVTRTSNRV